MTDCVGQTGLRLKDQTSATEKLLIKVLSSDTEIQNIISLSLQGHNVLLSQSDHKPGLHHILLLIHEPRFDPVTQQTFGLQE